MSTESPGSHDEGAAVAALQDVYESIRQELARIIVGQERIVRLLLACLLARGHCLLIGVPGLAKTLLVKTLSQCLQLTFRRIQFTPDLMPADIVGSEIIQENEGRLDFEYQSGPVFAHLVLADEINRTPPKTQAALLEAMQERHVTVAGQTRDLPDPFLVVATQNPIEQEGTYPLPEAQLDRFMFSLNVGYPDKPEEVEIVRRTTVRSLPEVTPCIRAEDIVNAQVLIQSAPVTDHVVDYAVEVAKATRPGDASAPQVTHDYVEWGAGPRASQYLILGAKAVALLSGKLTPEIEHVREVAEPVLRHRVITNYRATGAGVSADQVIEEILKTVPQESY